MKRTVIILAGGKSSRMGENKAFLKIENTSFIESILNKFEDYDQRIIVADDTSLYQYPEVDTLTDIYPNCGPLCGLYTGLMHSRNERNIVVTVDAPFLNEALLSYLTDQLDIYDVVVPVVDGGQHPLCSAYSKNALTVIGSAVEAGVRKVKRVYDDLRVLEVFEDDLKRFGDLKLFFKNINTPEDYLSIQEL